MNNMIPDMKQDEKPIRPYPNLEKLARALMLVGGGIGLALAGLSSLLNGNDGTSVKDNQTEQDDAQ